jgi:hypothetical protein
MITHVTHRPQLTVNIPDTVSAEPLLGRLGESKIYQNCSDAARRMAGHTGWVKYDRSKFHLGPMAITH